MLIVVVIIITVVKERIKSKKDTRGAQYSCSLSTDQYPVHPQAVTGGSCKIPPAYRLSMTFSGMGYHFG